MRGLIRTAALGCAMVTLALAPVAGAQDFPEGAQFAWIDIARVAAESAEGQAANTRVQELSQQKVAEIEARRSEAAGEVTALNQQLQEAQAKLQQGQNVISAEAMTSLQREIGRLQVDIQRTSEDSQADIARLTQDAEAEVQQLQLELQRQFEAQLVPAIDRLAADLSLSFIFSAAQGLVWADPAMDLTQELIESLNAQ